MSQQGRLRDQNLETLTGNTGGPVGPDPSGNINIIGNPPYEVTGNPATNTLTISDDGTVPLTFTEDTGTATGASNNINVFGDALQGSITSGSGDTITITNSDASETQKGVSELATNAETMAGTDSIKTIVPTALKAKLGTQIQNGVAYGNTDSAALQWISAGTNGQLIIAGTAAPPAFASLTSTGGTITFTSGVNSLNLESGGSVAITFDADLGTATPAANILNVNGTPAQGISSSGAGNTLTITAADSTTTQKGVLETSTDAESIAGSSMTVATTPASLGAKLGTQTSNGLAYGGGTTAAINWLSAATNGQLPIGNTGNAPTLATITAGTGITVTNGAGSIAIASNNGGMDWTEVTGTSQSMAVDNGYIANNAGLVTLTLPASAAIGDTIKIDGKGAGGWSIAQNGGQTIHFLSQNTTTGAGGSLASTNRYDCVALRCTTANTDFVVESVVGNLTVA